VRAAIPGTPSIPLPVTVIRACPPAAVKALTGTRPGATRSDTSVPGESGSAKGRTCTEILRPATGVSALSPEIMGLGPVEASRRALASAGMTINDMDLVEINEAFAVQVIASARDLGLDLERLNVHGGAIALGHPLGCTGARIMTTLLNAMRVRDVQFGLETMCVGGGQGMAIVLERLA